MLGFRFIAAIFITFITTAFVAASAFVALKLGGVNVESQWVGLAVFAGVILTAALTLRACARFLYIREAANVSVLGGVRFGSLPEVIMSGKGATWPFAKLLADSNDLWIHTPWGTLRWPRTDSLTLRSKQRLVSSVLMLSPEGSNAEAPISFFYFGRGLENQLRALGFKFDS